MRKGIITLLILSLAGGIFAAQTISRTAALPAANLRNLDPVGEEIVPANPGTAPAAMREAYGVLVDSSKNGYGLLAPETSPIAVNGDNVIMAYRQWAGAEGASGVIGAAHSEDQGLSWVTYSNVNAGTNFAGRYPSALAADWLPAVLWNEYGGGGGDYGGRAYYSFDEGLWGGGLWLPPTDIHNVPAANDTWMLKPTINVDGSGNTIFNAIATDWSGDREKIHFRSTNMGDWFGTILGWEDGWSIAGAGTFQGDASSNYTSEGNMDINADGIGYVVCSAYWADTLAIANHTLFIKRTEDFGATWSGWYHLADADMNAYFADVFPDSIYDETDDTWAVLPDGWTPFVGYEQDLIVDEQGDLHIFAGVLPSGGGFVYPGWSEANGLYHFMVPNEAFAGGLGPVTPTINFISSLQLHWLYTAFADPAWQANVYSAAYDTELADHLYVIYHSVGDTTGDNIFLDVFGAFSEDGGLTWSEPMNLTQTSMDNLDESDPHIFREARSGKVFMIYQTPDWDNPTVNPPAQMEDYKQRVYFWDYTFDVVGVDEQGPQPTAFELRENYPNPFNPSTILEYRLETAGQVSLKIYDLTGREIRTLVEGSQNSGLHRVHFDGSGLASGIYLARLQSGTRTAVNRMMLLR